MNTIEKRNFHLSFCATCKNKDYSLKSGIICKLTNNIADFENRCSSFSEDFEERIKLRKKLKEKIHTNYPDSNFLSDLVSDKNYSHFNSSILRKSKYHTKSETHNLTISHETKTYRVLMFIVIAMLCFISFFDYQTIINFPFNFEKLGVFYIMILLIILLYYSGYIHKFKTILKTDNLGIEYNGKKIFWKQILTSKLISEKQGESRVTKLLLGMSSDFIMEINLESIDIPSYDFWKIIQLNTD